MAIKHRRSDAPPDQVAVDDRRSSGGNRCPVPLCTGHLRGDTDEIGRVSYRCEECERRARLEHGARFGTYLDHLRAQRRTREAEAYEAATSEAARRCEICDEPLTPPNTRVCDKVACKRAWKAEYQRQRFGRASKEAASEIAALELFRDYP